MEKEEKKKYSEGETEDEMENKYNSEEEKDSILKEKIKKKIEKMENIKFKYGTARYRTGINRKFPWELNIYYGGKQYSLGSYKTTEEIEYTYYEACRLLGLKDQKNVLMPKHWGTPLSLVKILEEEKRFDRQKDLIIDGQAREHKYHPEAIFKNYCIFENGKIWSIKHRKFLKPYLNKKGYCAVGIVINKKKDTIFVHQIICETFHGLKPSEDMSVDHKDGEPTNNVASNLRWASPRDQNLNRRTQDTSKSTSCTKRVHKIDPETNKILKTYVSGREAARKNKGVSQKRISECCCGKAKTHAGFKWKFADPEIPVIDKEGEIWKPFIDRKDYFISDLGRIKRIENDKVILVHDPKLKKLSKVSNYYYLGYITDNKKQRTIAVHIIVMEAFRGPTPEGQFVHHTYNDPEDNTLLNLKFAIREEIEKNSHEINKRKLEEEKKQEEKEN